MAKAHIGEDEWGHSDFQQRRDDVKQRKLEKRMRKETRKRKKHQEGSDSW